MDEEVLEEFAVGSQYEEILRKCFLCARMITSDPVERQVLGVVQQFDSEQHVEDLERYRMPYVRREPGA